MSTPSELGIEQLRARGDRSESTDLYRSIREQVEQHPYRALAIAAGVGFILGGGLSRRATSRLFTTGLRVGLASAVGPLVAELADRLRGERTRARH